MVAYGFQARFIDAILSGRKAQTIRAERRRPSRHARAGETLQIYTAMRTRRCRLIGTAVCASVTPITLYFCGGPAGRIWWCDILALPALRRLQPHDLAALVRLTPALDLDAFAQADGGTLRSGRMMIRWDDFQPAAAFGGLS